MREHEQESAAAAPMPAPFAAAGGIGQVLGPARVLAMQRTAGNAATTGYLLRNPTATAAPVKLAAGDLDGKMGRPAARSGAGIAARVEAHAGGDLVIAESDFVDLKGKITAKETDPANPGATIDPEARVGFIQTLEQVGRIGKYTDDGTARAASRTRRCARTSSPARATSRASAPRPVQPPPRRAHRRSTTSTRCSPSAARPAT